MTGKIIVLVGLPGSGKTTWVLNEMNKNGGKRVNRDALRMMVDGGVYSKENEEGIRAIETDIIELFVSKGYTVYVDDTNLGYYVSFWKLFARTFPVEIDMVIQDFTHVPIEVCIERDKARGSRSAGEQVIRDMWKAHLDCKVLQEE